jgi:hypothetical protein
MRVKLVRCVDCGTIYKIPAKQKRLKSYESCPNDDCNGKYFRCERKAALTEVSRK